MSIKRRNVIRTCANNVMVRILGTRSDFNLCARYVMFYGYSGVELPSGQGVPKNRTCEALDLAISSSHSIFTKFSFQLLFLF